VRSDDEDQRPLFLGLRLDTPQELEVERVESRDDHADRVAEVALTASERAAGERLDDRADAMPGRHDPVLLQPRVRGTDGVDVDVQGAGERADGWQPGTGL
jgi:hypothetical protein